MAGARPKIVVRHRYDDYLQAKSYRQVMCFIDNIRRHVKPDMSVLNKWIEYFKEQDVPFCVLEKETRTGLRRELWKIRKV